VVGLCLGAVASVLDVRSRAALLDDVGGRSETTSSTEQAVQSPSDAAREIYQSLSDAEVALANAFLNRGPESPEIVTYQADLARATSQLTVVAAASTETSTHAVSDLSINLSLYEGQVMVAALAYNRRELPPAEAHQLGARYLRESAVTAREKILPAAKQLFDEETERRTEAQRRASATPWVELTLGTVLICCLVAVQICLFRWTKRLFNVGLVLATLAAITALIWMGVASLTAAGLSEASRLDGTAQVEALTAVKVTGLQARADELMTLVAHGDGDDYFDQRFEKATREITGNDGLLAMARRMARQPNTLIDSTNTAFDQWQLAHDDLRATDEKGDHAKAIHMATSTDTGSAGELARDFDNELDAAIRSASNQLNDDVLKAKSALSHVDVLITLLMACSVVSSISGMWQRIKEYL
jgi:hypothetical protein